MHSTSASNNEARSTKHEALPRHVAIIMDGNGRWAKARGLPRTAGHKKGADTLRTVLTASRDAGVKYLTVYAFSSENWKRPAEEVGELMQLLKLYINREIKALHENGVCVRFIGDRSALSDDIRALLAQTETLTQGNTAFYFTVALSYGSRQELIRAFQQLVEQGVQPQDITEDALMHALDTHALPDPDLLIRTGGEQRLSNFLLWQSAYTELYFTETYWPEFSREDFMAALTEYARRERRYGNAN